MGFVYKAEDATLARPIALKFLPDNLSASEGVKTRFLHEARGVEAE